MSRPFSDMLETVGGVKLSEHQKEVSVNGMVRFFVKQPIIVAAFQYGVDDIPQWFFAKDWHNEQEDIPDSPLIIETLEGDMKADIGDYIIEGLRGEIYPCKADIFEASYKEVTPKEDAQT